MAVIYQHALHAQKLCTEQCFAGNISPKLTTKSQHFL
jgi:hypothetical protein